MEHILGSGYIAENGDGKIEVTRLHPYDTMYFTKEDIVRMFKMFKNDCTHITKVESDSQCDGHWLNTDRGSGGPLICKYCPDCGVEIDE